MWRVLALECRPSLTRSRFSDTLPVNSSPLEAEACATCWRTTLFLAFTSNCSKVHIQETLEMFYLVR
jgi:hypothetical protein